MARSEQGTVDGTSAASREVMSLIDDFMPRPWLREVDHIAVAADPAAAWAAVRSFDLYRVSWIRALFALRVLPDRVSARLHGRELPFATAGRIDDIARAGSGFTILAEVGQREIVVGSIGKFWQSAIHFAMVTPEHFREFDREGFGKLAWSLSVDPRIGGGSWISFDLRVDATDRASLEKLTRYWRLIGRFSRAIRRTSLRTYEHELGKLPEDVRRLPGDELLATAKAQRTHAITIEASPKQVWPWLVQMGCRRAGFYSIDRLDNSGLPSAERIIPALQHLAVGDVIPASPDGPGGFSVLHLDPARSLVLGSPELGPELGTRTDGSLKMTWAFVLDPIGDAATRLIVRVRGDYPPNLRSRLAAIKRAVQHEVMERVQLRHLKQRAESLQAATSA